MIGTRGHDIGQMEAAELAKTASQIGAAAIQLVAYKAINGIGDTADSINNEISNIIRRDFEKQNIKISLIGSYFNLLDEQTLDTSIIRFKKYLECAKSFGCDIVGTETGSYDKKWGFHKDNHSDKAFEKVVAIVNELVNEAEICGVCLGIEGVYNHVIYSPERMQELIKRIPSPNLKVIFDPVNYVYAANYESLDQIIDKAFDLFGERITLIHAKDFIIENGNVVNVALGKGLVNYEKIKQKISEQERNIDIIIEELTGQQLLDGLSFLKRKGF